jgi:hypothetical protein
VLISLQYLKEFTFESVDQSSSCGEAYNTLVSAPVAQLCRLTVQVVAAAMVVCACRIVMSVDRVCIRILSVCTCDSRSLLTEKLLVTTTSPSTDMRDYLSLLKAFRMLYR